MTKKKTIYYEELVDPFSSGKKNFLIKAEHFMRYEFAKRFINKSDVVYDIACGNGFGTKILSEKSNNVAGFDKNDHFLAYAKKRNNSADFYKADAENIYGFVKEKDLLLPDVIVCFETIEHLDDPEKFLKDAYKLIRDEGVIIASVPNGKLEPKAKGVSKNKFHKHIFYKKDIEKLFGDSGFKIEKWWGQPLSNYIVTHLRAIERKYLNKLLNKKFNFKLASYIFAYPLRFLRHRSYSIIFIGKKN
ncbi:methyltransferase domain-containing protein [Candidatus Woesearchaeota archaeon]|nr:methyltransferase domain-containing protein [Candidatus Woesearchaeota archaeon]